MGQKHCNFCQGNVDDDTDGIYLREHRESKDQFDEVSYKVSNEISKLTRGGDEKVPKMKITQFPTSHDENFGIPFPIEIVIEIVLFLTLKDILTCFQVCKLWNNLLNTNFFWKMNYSNVIPSFQTKDLNNSIETKSKSQIRWKENFYRDYFPKFEIYDYNDIYLLKVIGSRDYHEVTLNVYQAEIRKTKKPPNPRINLLVFKTSQFDPNGLEDFIREINICLTVIHHLPKYFLNILGITLNKPRIGLCFEPIETNLSEFVEKNDFTLKQKVMIMRDVAIALNYLTSRTFICHIEPQKIYFIEIGENVLFDKKIFRGKIDILDLQHILDQPQHTGYGPTYIYDAPERYYGSRYSEKVMVFELSVLLFEFISSLRPYGDMSPRAAMTRVSSDPDFRPISAPRNVGEQFNENNYSGANNDLFGLMKRMWMHDPKMRIEMKVVVEELEKVLLKI